MHWADFMLINAKIMVRRDQFNPSTETIAYHRDLFAKANHSEDLTIRAQVHYALGYTLLLARQLDEAEYPLEEGLKLARQNNYIYTQTVCLTYLALLFRMKGDDLRVVDLVEQCLAISPGIRVYRAAAYANKAWLAMRANNFDVALAEAKKAQNMWGDYPYPFRWSASWVQLYIFTTQGEFQVAIDEAVRMMHPSQQKQPDAISFALEAAISAWKKQQIEGVGHNLQMAAKIARLEGFL
jgi:tetratricopeptide (TPR) repeat protein